MRANSLYRFMLSAVVLLLAAARPATPAALSCGIEQIARGEGRSMLGASMSADGRRVAFRSTADPTGSNPDGSAEIFLWDEGAGVTQVTNDFGAVVDGPALSADGRRIAFVSQGDILGTNQDNNREVFLWDEEGGFSQVTDTGFVSGTRAATVDRTGGRLAFATLWNIVGSNPDGNREVFLWDGPEEPPISQLTDSTGDLGSRFPWISADGRHIAFASNGDPVGGNGDRSSELFLWTEEAGVRQLTDTSDGANTPQGISADGRRILLFPSPELVEGGGDETGTLARPIALWDEATGFRVVGGPRLDVRSPALSGDGRRVAFFSPSDPLGTNPDGNVQVFLWDEATGLTQVTRVQSPDHTLGRDISLSFDGRRLVFDAPTALVGTGPVGGTALYVGTCSEPGPPEGPWLSSPEVPGFRFKVRVTARDGTSQPVRREPECIPETLCVSAAVPGRSEVFLRVVGPKPNGKLWPTLVKFSTSTAEIWVEQTSTGEVRYYVLEGARPGFDRLPGGFDRDGFGP